MFCPYCIRSNAKRDGDVKGLLVAELRNLHKGVTLFEERGGYS